MRLRTAERDRVFDAVAHERRGIADLIDGLTPEQLATPSLCGGWDVKTVAAHLVSDFLDGFRGFLVSGIRHGNMDKGIDAWPVGVRKPPRPRSPRRCAPGPSFA